MPTTNPPEDQEPKDTVNPNEDPNETDFSNYVGDFPTSNTNRNIFSEIKEGFDPNPIIDEIQYEMGLKERPKPPKLEFDHKIKVFNFTKKEHVELYQTLLNDKDKYRIVGMDKTWTNLGEYMMFVHYVEIKKDTKEKKNDQKSPNTTPPVS